MAGGLNWICQIMHFYKTRLSLYFDLSSLYPIYCQSTQQPAKTILLEASMHFYKSLCPLVGPLFHWSVGWLVNQSIGRLVSLSITNSFSLVNFTRNHYQTILGLNGPPILTIATTACSSFSSSSFSSSSSSSSTYSFSEVNFIKNHSRTSLGLNGTTNTYYSHPLIPLVPSIRYQDVSLSPCGVCIICDSISAMIYHIR